MKKQDELNLWEEVKDIETYKVINWDESFKKLDIPIGRGYYIIGKWCNRDIIEFGVSLRFAWLCDKSKWKP